MTDSISNDVLYCALALQLGATSNENAIAALKKVADGDCESLVAALGVEPTQQRAIEHLVRIREKRRENGSGTEPDISDQTIGLNITPLGGVQPTQRSDDRFETLALHKEGGLGQVFVATDRQLGRKVALKEIRDRFVGDVHNRNRFTLEAEVTARLEHPGIVPVYARGEYHDGRPYYVMKFIHGDTMRSAINEHHEFCETRKASYNKGVELRRLLQRFRDVCNAIAYAHDRGVLHRDLKPSNIMFGKFGETLVVDWGLAQLRGENPGEVIDSTMMYPTDDVSFTEHSVGSRQGRAIGSAGYMSPEQARGERETLTAATDIYGLGAVLYSILTNRAPIEGTTHLDFHEKTVNGEITSPRTWDRTIPAALSAITMKALSTDPMDRYETVRDLVDDVERFMASEPVEAHRESFIERLRRLGRRNQAAVTAATAALFLVATIASISAVQISRNQQQSEYLVGFVRESFQIPEEIAMTDNLTEFVDELGKSYLENDELFAKGGQYAVDFHEAIGNAYLRLDRFQKAREFLESTLQTLRKAGCPDDELEVVIHNLGGSQFHQASILLGQAKKLPGDGPTATERAELLEEAYGELKSSVTSYQDSLGVKRRKYGKSHRKTLAARQMLGRCLLYEAKILAAQNKQSLAKVPCRKAIEVLDEVLDARRAISDSEKAIGKTTKHLDSARELFGEL